VLSGLSRPTLYRAIAAGQLSTRKYGSRTIIIVEELRAFLSNLPRGGARHV
jgi:predicted DNA-binding transcriptional regulator AlpA